jgi:hypothetical protein
MPQENLIAISERHHRFEKNVAGDFYTTGDCMQCNVPEEAAPDLLAELTAENIDTYFIRQPTSAAEVEQACKAVLSCCADALRYGGTDPDIIRRLGNRPSSSDFLLPGGPIRFPDENDFSWEIRDGGPKSWFARFWKRFQRL